MAMVVGNTDVLTGLFNMKGLKQNYGSYLSKNKNCSVIAFDFAKLKYINDNYGHAVGDSCLSNFGEVLKQNFYGDISVRRSGDEFIVVTSKSPDEIEKALNGCISDIVLFYELGDIQVKYSFNAGIVEASHGIDQTLE
ncbi:MAG: GGDEF domain-containing protein, partial [Bacilli bacterium]|nr:GGDEF domain-containing protein [Bacilli bacterium]